MNLSVSVEDKKTMDLISNTIRFLAADGVEAAKSGHPGIRAIPRVHLMRPCDANETAYTWQYAIARNGGTTSLALTRQNLPTLDRSKYASAEGVLKGAYILEDEKGADLLIVASGSEVHLAIEVAGKLRTEGRKVRIVSMPCIKLFRSQPAGYQQKVLPDSISKRVVIEAGIMQGWEGIIGRDGLFVGVQDFGRSGPYKVLAKELGLNADAVLARIKTAGL